jgi:23S rRNA pseudouridine2605 synthase
LSIRLNKLLARRGVGARRKCDVLIQQGRVRVNGHVVREPGTMVEPERDRIEVAGHALPPPAEHRYYVLNKPVGVISTLDDPEGRRTIRDLLPPGPRLFPVGRLDADTSGLLVLTNDGELAHRLMHPRYGVEKVYRVWVDRAPSAAQLARLRDGVEFEPGIVSEPARVRPLPADAGRGLIEIGIHEGRYRQVRRMCEAVGLRVTGLHRWAYGPVRLGMIERGMWRELSAEEVARLRAASARPQPRSRRGGEFFSARRGLVRNRRGRPAVREVRPRPARAFRPTDRRGRGEEARERPRPEPRGRFGDTRGPRPRPEPRGRFGDTRGPRPRPEPRGRFGDTRGPRPRPEPRGRFGNTRGPRPRPEPRGRFGDTRGPRAPSDRERVIRDRRPGSASGEAGPRRFERPSWNRERDTERGPRPRRSEAMRSPRRSRAEALRPMRPPRPRSQAGAAPREERSQRSVRRRDRMGQMPRNGARKRSGSGSSQQRRPRPPR